MWRYNPDSSSTRAVRVRSDSPEALEWPTRRPTGLGSPRTQRKLEQAGERVGRVAVPAAVAGVARVVTKGGRAVARVVKVAAPIAGQAALVAAVGAGAYLGASYIREQIVNGATNPEFIVSMAALRARRDVQSRIGRALTAAELHQLRDQLAKRFTVMEATMRVAAPFGIGELVNLLRRAL